MFTLVPLTFSVDLELCILRVFSVKVNATGSQPSSLSPFTHLERVDVSTFIKNKIKIKSGKVK